MKTGNYPAKRNARRIGAANRLKRDNPEFKILLGRIMTFAVAQGIRTKKDRHDKAKFGRNK